MPPAPQAARPQPVVQKQDKGVQVVSNFVSEQDNFQRSFDTLRQAQPTPGERVALQCEADAMQL